MRDDGGSKRVSMSTAARSWKGRGEATGCQDEHRSPQVRKGQGLGMTVCFGEKRSKGMRGESDGGFVGRD